MADNLLDGVRELIKSLQDTADETGETQSQTFSTGGWQDVNIGGKKVGRYRIEAAEITITPSKKRKTKKSHKA